MAEQQQRVVVVGASGNLGGLTWTQVREVLAARRAG